MRFALFSPVLPPTQGGQPIILNRVLQGFEARDYCLIGDERFDQQLRHATATQGLQAARHFLKPVTSKPRPPTYKREIPLFTYFATREITARARQIAHIVREESCDLLVGCSGDPYSFVAASLAARFAKVAYVPYFFDDFAYQGARIMRPVMWMWERMCVRFADAVIVTNESSAFEYERRHGVPCHVVHNACPPFDLAALDAAPLLLDKSNYNIVFAGAIYNAHYDAFRNLIAAIRKLDDPNIRLHLFTAQEPQQLAEMGIAGPMIEHHAYLNQEKIAAVQRQADLLFLPLAFKSPYGRLLLTSSPGKTAEYLALGRPILVHAPQDSFISWYFRTKECGNVVDVNDVAALSTKLQNIRQNHPPQAPLMANAMRCAKSDFSVEAAHRGFQKALEAARANRK